MLQKRLEVGAQAMDSFVYVLQNDSSDNEIVTYVLDSLLNVICNEDSSNENDNNKSASDFSVQFTEIFIKRKENVQLILDLLPEFDFKIRYPTIKLIQGLLRNKLRDCQDCILTHPMGISRMMDLLIDPREVIRNDALLLLVFLTKSNSNIQKIVAFENAFDRILEIISNEGYSDGGMVVEDCLSILLNLLKMNTSNQNYFKEGNYIQRLLPFLDISYDVDWNISNKVNNLLLMFKVIRSLVSPSNPLQVTNSCQKVMYQQSGILQNLCTILLSNGIPAIVLTETINCVAEVIRGNQQNQEYFSRVNAPIEPARPVIVVLLMSMINEKQPFELRCAVLYCFQSFLYKNELGQAQIVETLLPTTTDADVSAGQLLCGGFFSNDILCNWFVAVSLSHTLVNNVTQKEQLLRVQLATDPNSSPISLLTFCSNLLQKGGHHQRRVSLTDLCKLIQNRIGVDIYADKLASIAKNEKYSQTLQKPYITTMKSAELLFDYEFCNLFKLQEASILKIVQPSSDQQNGPESNLTSEDHKLLLQYKELIREQDLQLISLRKQLVSLSTENATYKTQLDEQQSIVQQLRDQIALLKVHKSVYDQSNPYSNYMASGQNMYQQQTATTEVNCSYGLNSQPTEQCAEQSSVLATKNEVPVTDSYAASSQAISSTEAQLRQHIDQLNYELSVRDQNLHLLTNQLNSMQIYDNHGSNNNTNTSQSQTVADSNQLEYMFNENRRLQSIIDQYKYWEANYYANSYNQQLNDIQQGNKDGSLVVQPTTNTVVPDGNEKQENKVENNETDKLRHELETLRKEQDDLITLLADQDLKMQKYVRQMKDHGLSVADDFNELTQISSPPRQPCLNQLETDNIPVEQQQHQQLQPQSCYEMTSLINQIGTDTTTDLNSQQHAFSFVGTN
ncbi:Vesicle-mediated ER to Golgi transport protein [Blomia tropicalis]|nr:Vesicle-mediated ER to Golgi transport protein [Blomia tropicalis]